MHLQDAVDGDLLVRQRVHGVVHRTDVRQHLVRRDVAIVSSVPGTTRDAIEVDLDLGGYAVTLIDTAGLRDTTDAIESEGIKRARAKAQYADLRLGVLDASAPVLDSRVSEELSASDALLLNKCDAMSSTVRSAKLPLTSMQVSAKTGEGIAALLAWLEREVIARAGSSESMPMTRARHREALADAHAALARFTNTKALDLAAEDLRIAARALGRITGRVDVEDLLDVIFREFCIGK